MVYDVCIIGGGLSGLTAGALLAKRGLKVAIIEQAYNPGGTCGIFKRGDTIFDIGSAMLYGFGEHGFNAHRFVFNALEEPIDIIAHDVLYSVYFNGHRIRFWPDVDRFCEELSNVFPSEKEGIYRFYRDMGTMYQHVMVDTPSYVSADETNPILALKSVLKHPLSYLRFLSYLNKSAKDLLSQYFTSPEIFHFFDKLTSTYCYATVEEAPAVLAAVMFIDNHVGGSYYPAGSTLFLPGKLEKVIEEHGGDMFLESEVVSIDFEGKTAKHVHIKDGRQIDAKDFIYSGTVWNLYGKLIKDEDTTPKRLQWMQAQEATHPSLVLYTKVRRSVIPDNTDPIEMLVGSVDSLDESEVTAYILSMDDRSVCEADEHVVLAIGPSFNAWFNLDQKTYKERKQVEIERMLNILEKRFPGFKDNTIYTELATPKTIERYTLKNGGAVAGPKQMLGQHMLKRQHVRTDYKNLYCCGESTVMGTGTPTVTTSGLSAANAILKKRGIEQYQYKKGMKNYVRMVEKPFTKDRLYEQYPEAEQTVMTSAMRCRFCEHPTCTKNSKHDVRGTMRRVAVGNFIGAKKNWEKVPASPDELAAFEANCIKALEGEQAVEISNVVAYLSGALI